MTRTPQVGDTYIVARRFATLGTKSDELDPYEPGDYLEIVGTTDINPFGHDVGTNWLVKCKHYEPPQLEATWAWLHKFVREEIILLLEKDQ